MLRCGTRWTPYLRRPLFPAEHRGAHRHLLGQFRHTTTAWPGWLSNPTGASSTCLALSARAFPSTPMTGACYSWLRPPTSSPLLALIAPQLARQGGVGLLVQGRHGCGPLTSRPSAAGRRVLHGHGRPNRRPRPDPRLCCSIGRCPGPTRLCAAGSASFLAPAQAQDLRHAVCRPGRNAARRICSGARARAVAMRDRRLPGLPGGYRPRHPPSLPARAGVRSDGDG